MSTIRYFMSACSVCCMVFCLGISPTGASPADLISKRVHEATALLNAVSMRPKILITKDRILERPIVVAAFDDVTNEWKLIDLQIPSKYQKEFGIRVVTQGCTAEHIRGYGPVRFVAHIFCDGRELTVYRAKHVIFPDGARAYLKGGAARALAGMEEESYTAYYDRLHDRELANRGARFIGEAVTTALEELRQQKVMSRAVPGSLLGDSVPYELLSALSVIEQSDVDAFDEDPEGTIEGVLIHFALNRKNAFRLARSSADARGAYQFTNKKKNGTYTLVVRAYPDARLDKNFESGTEDLHNIIKAAVCLIDLEMASFPELRDEYVAEPLTVGMYAVAAYNGGHNAAYKFHTWRLKKGLEISDLTIDNLPSAFAKNRETPKYLEKYLYVITEALDTIGIHSREAS